MRAASSLLCRSSFFVALLGSMSRAMPQAMQAAARESVIEQRLRECEATLVTRPLDVIEFVERTLLDPTDLPGALRARLRTVRGEAMLRSGRGDEALAEFRSLDEEGHADARLRARIALRLAGSLVQHARVAEARPHIERGARLVETAGGHEERLILLGVQGVVLQTEGRFQGALEKYLDALATVREGGGRPEAEATWHYNIASVQMAVGDGEGARASLADARRLSPGGHHLAMILGAQAMLVPAAGEPQQRRSLLVEALRIEREIRSRSGEALFLRRIGDLDAREGRFDDAIANFEASLAITRTTGNVESIASSIIALADVHLQAGRTERAIELGEEALPLADSLGMPVVELHVSKVLSDAHAKAGHFERALELHRKFATATASLSDERTRGEVTRMRSAHEAELTAREHAAALSHQVLVRNTAIGGAIGALIVVAFLVRMLRQRAQLMRDLVQQHAEVRAAQDKVNVLGTQLGAAIEDVKRLSGLLPICAHCKSIRDNGGAWHRLEEYVTTHSEASFTHGICPSCLEEHFPGV